MKTNSSNFLNGFIAIAIAINIIALTSCSGGSNDITDVAIPRTGTAVINGENVTVSGTFTQAGLNSAIADIQEEMTEIIERFAGFPPGVRDGFMQRLAALNTINIGPMNYPWRTKESAANAIWINSDINNLNAALELAITAIGTDATGAIAMLPQDNNGEAAPSPLA